MKVLELEVNCGYGEPNPLGFGFMNIQKMTAPELGGPMPVSEE